MADLSVFGNKIDFILDFQRNYLKFVFNRHQRQFGIEYHQDTNFGKKIAFNMDTQENRRSIETNFYHHHISVGYTTLHNEENTLEN